MMHIDKNTLFRMFAVAAATALALAGCGGGGGGGAGASNPGSGAPANTWTWVSGLANGGSWGIYGTKGVAAATNMPSARSSATSWTDSAGHLWLFGGLGYDSTGAGGNLNDLWKFDGTNWTWVSGSNLQGQHGVYGTKGVAAATNVPGARTGAVSWVDSAGNFWLFGGNGYAAASIGELNDLWKFDGTNWTWVAGGNASTQSGVYGTKGTAAATNVPGSRDSAVSWTDAAGNHWVFGGKGLDSAGAQGSLNDMWRFDGSNWTWMGGATVVNQPGVYGTKGTAAATNIPGARYGAVSALDAAGNLWLFSGSAVDSAGTNNIINDLWKFDGTNWTWVSGANLAVQPANYGTKGVAAATNVPGTRMNAVGWIDGSGNFWAFGGNGYDSNGQLGFLNDLWKFDGTNWTWVNGANINNQAGTYTAPGATPGGRYTSSMWRDGSGRLWLFGGMGLDSSGALPGNVLNDLWVYQP